MSSKRVLDITTKILRQSFSKRIEHWEMLVDAELTGKFIEISSSTLDFGMCVFNSVYQLSFDISNSSKLPHRVQVRFPPDLEPYLQSNPNDMYIQSRSSTTSFVKFFPRKEITLSKDIKYYDPSTEVLEFPIYVSLTTKRFVGTPPTKIIVYAILTEPNGLSIKPSELGKHVLYISNIECEDDSEYIIDMGSSTTAETICTELELTNNSYVLQTFGFLELPQCLKITPNYGFGEILPMEVKKLVLVFSPETKDIPNYDLLCEEANRTLVFRLIVETVKNMGGIEKIKKPFSLKCIKRSLKTTADEFERDPPLSLMEDMRNYLYFLRDKRTLNLLELEEISETELRQFQFDQGSISKQVSIEENYNEKIREEEETEEETEEKVSDDLNIINNTVLVKATVIDSLCDISHQYVEFPDTPCGSYSVMFIELRARHTIGDFKCVCGYVKKFSKCKKHLQFNAHFAIHGNNSEIDVEPTCGILKSGQKIKLTLIAKPELSNDVVMEKAKKMAIEKLLEQKRQKWQIKRENEMAAKLAKGNNGKVEVVRETMEPEPKFVVEENEIVLDNFDLYQAEMAEWKTMESYFIEGNFKCIIDYVSEDIQRKPEYLYFNTLCKVIKPHFVHNLNSQHIDFGPIPIGTSSRKIISIQNIQRFPIKPTVTPLSCLGSFAIGSALNLELPPEYHLRLPLTFSPSKQETVIEYFEIRAESTVCPLIVSGEGVPVNITISPDFLVYRLTANYGNFADCDLDIINQSKAPVVLNFVKLCELEGEIKQLGKNRSTTKSLKDKTNVAKVNKFSADLTEEEEFSLINFFNIKTGEPYFKLVNGDGDAVQIGPFSKKAVKIRFEMPLPPDENAGNGKNGGKKGMKRKVSKPMGPELHYVVKYNVMLERSKFLKDIIIIGIFQ